MRIGHPRPQRERLPIGSLGLDEPAAGAERVTQVDVSASKVRLELQSYLKALRRFPVFALLRQRDAEVVMPFREVWPQAQRRDQVLLGIGIFSQRMTDGAQEIPDVRPLRRRLENLPIEQFGAWEVAAGVLLLGGRE
ncbi:MAG: hypothetical protein EXR98_01585 [Gemmataceae bacterium]|nr:hypothetical protein [Gemmataceae bacterium]